MKRRNYTKVIGLNRRNVTIAQNLAKKEKKRERLNNTIRHIDSTIEGASLKSKCGNVTQECQLTNPIRRSVKQCHDMVSRKGMAGKRSDGERYRSSMCAENI